MQAKEVVLDRIEQSFELFKNNFQTLFIPMFGYSIVSTVFTVIATYFGIKKLGELVNSQDVTGLGFYEMFYNPQSMIIIVVGIVVILMYLILYIPFLLGLIKSISQAYNGEKPNWEKNLKYGFTNLGNSFKTYWYIFAYVALIPALLFIVGGMILLYGMQYNDSYIKFGGFIIGLSLIIFLFFSIYRGTKAAFGIYSAVDYNNYSLENFKQSVNITQNKVWRILGNLLLVGFIGGLVIGMIQGVIDNLGSTFGISAESISEQIIGNSPDYKAIINTAIQSYSPISNIITNTLQGIIKTLFSVFIIVFIYILFKRLELEKSEVEREKKVEL